MDKITIEIHEDVISVIEKIKNAGSSQVELIIPEGAVIFENGLNLKLIKKESERVGKTINFITEDENGIYLIDTIEGGRTENTTSDIADDFVQREVAIEEIIGSPKTRKKSGLKIQLPKVGLKKPEFNLSKVSLPKFNFKSGALVVVGVAVLLLILGIGGYQFFWRVPKANVKVTVSSQPLIKSVELEVNTTAKSSADERTLEGEVISAVVEESKTIDTTGEKIVGEKAKGKIKIINRTPSDKEFEKGDELYSIDDDDLVYELDDDVLVPGGTSETPANPSDPVVLTPGTAEVEVIAKEIGKDYNLDSGETLKFDDYSTSNYIAEVSDDIDGGSSETVRIIAQEDLDLLVTQLEEELGDKGETALKNGVKNDKVYIEGSLSETLAEEEYSGSVGDDAKEVTLTRKYSYQGLTYSDKDLNDLLEDLLKGFVPDGFELSEEDRDVSVQVLGNSDVTTLSTTQADLQVTLKSFVIPEVDEDDIKSKLAGVKLSEAEKILGGVRNIRTYAISVEPNIPLIGRMPRNVENISIEIVKE